MPDLLATRSPTLRAALRTGHTPRSRVRGHQRHPDSDRPDRRRPFYSGKQKKHGMNLQSIASPDGTTLRVSGELPGSRRDTAAARNWHILTVSRDAGRIALGDKDYHGYDETGRHVITPHKGRHKLEFHKTSTMPSLDCADPASAPTSNTNTGASSKKRRCSPALAGWPKPPRTTELRSHHRIKRSRCRHR